jgi:chromosome segregation ATPase
MALAMALIGLLFGIALTVTVAVFAVLSMDGAFADNLRLAARAAQARLTGRHRPSAPVVASRSPEADSRIRGLQEEVKVMQRLLEQGRVEREQAAATAGRSAEEKAALHAAIAERDEKIVLLQETVRSESAQSARWREELAQRAAELAAARRELRDLETELSVAQSGAGYGAVSGEIERLTQERDELAVRVERLTRMAAVVR